MKKPIPNDRLFTEDRIEITKAVNTGRTVIIPGDGLTIKRAVAAMVKKMNSYYYLAYEIIEGKLTHYGYAIPK